MYRYRIIPFVLLLICGVSVHARPLAAQGAEAADSAAVVATVERFHAALAAGDSVGALALLSADAVILESGGVETREEYRAHHLPSDMAFAQAVRAERVLVAVRLSGDAAWVSATSSAAGTYRDRAVNSAGAELVVLRREGGGWRIAAIHWSSRPRRS